MPFRCFTVMALMGAFSLPAAAKDPDVLSLGTDHFRDTATVQDNGAAGVTISTEPGYVQHTGLMRMIWSDEFLRASIDRHGGRRSFEVVYWIIYSGHLRGYQTVTYGNGGTSRSSPLAVVSRLESGCATGECTYTERVSFPVEERELRSLAASGTPVLWHFTLAAASGPNATGGLSTAEIAGLLAKVDAYEANPTAAAPPRSAVDAPATEPPAPPRPLEFGIAGMRVEAADEQPDRAGILVTGVARGSAAARAGILTGDIIHDVGGRGMASVPDLQAALAGCRSSRITINLYRGTARTSIQAQCP